MALLMFCLLCDKKIVMVKLTAKKWKLENDICLFCATVDGKCMVIYATDYKSKRITREMLPF